MPALSRRRLAAFSWAGLTLAFCASLAFAQAPPGANEEPPGGKADPPKLDLFKEIPLFGKSSGGDGPHVKFFGSFTVEKPGRQGTLLVTATIDEGWHLYSLTQPKGGPMPSSLKVAESPEFKVTGNFAPDKPPHIKPPSVFPVPSEEHEGTVIWSAPIELAEGGDPTKLKITATFNGQVCKDGDGGQCIPIFGEKIDAGFAGYKQKGDKAGEFRFDAKQAEVTLRGHIEPAAAAPGGKAKLVITAEPTAGWHVYAYAPKDPPGSVAKPTLIYVSPLTGWTHSPVKLSAPPKVKPAALKTLPDEKFYDQPVTWTIDFSLPADAHEGEAVLSGYVGVQTCKNKGGCLFPSAVQFRAALPIKANAAAGQVPLEFTLLERVQVSESKSMGGYAYVADLCAKSPAPTGELDWRGLMPMIGFGLLGGLILNLMPCVLPVIGLKVLSFVQQAGHSRAHVFALNLWFALGLLSVFAMLATAAAFANLGWGQQFTYTWFKVSMVVLVFAFALSFLGVWEVPIPGFAQSGTSSKLQHQEGTTGAFFKGVFTTLLATPCSGPFLGPVFAFTLAQPPPATYLIFGSVGLGMASPYLVIGAFPALVRWLPKPGEWMETVKQLMGFVLLGTVVYLFSTINARYFIPTLTLVIGVWLGCWIIGRVPVYEEFNKQVRNWTLGLATAAGIGWFAFTFLGPVQHLYQWQPYTPEAIAKLQGEGKTVMVDFTADWCLTCQANFKLAINTRRVKDVVERNGVAAVLADWSDHNDAIKEKLVELNSNSIPLLAIYPADRPGEVIVLRDAITQKQLLSALQQAGPSKKLAATAKTAQPPQPPG
jgi:thiol:disulfide interchange protein